MKKLVCIAATLLAIGISFVASPARAAQPITKADFIAVCPLDLPGAAVHSTATADGLVVAFETGVANSLPELKVRVEKLSALINTVMEQPADVPRGTVKFSSAFEATEKGANVVLKPADPKDLEKLQTNVSAKMGTMNAEKKCHFLANVG